MGVALRAAQEAAMQAAGKAAQQAAMQAAERAAQKTVIHAAEQAAQQALQATGRGSQELPQQWNTKPLAVKPSSSECVSSFNGGLRKASPFANDSHIKNRSGAADQRSEHENLNTDIVQAALHAAQQAAFHAAQQAAVHVAEQAAQQAAQQVVQAAVHQSLQPFPQRSQLNLPLTSQPAAQGNRNPTETSNADVVLLEEVLSEVIRLIEEENSSSNPYSSNFADTAYMEPYQV